jgi:outer membrane protein assembly factor BamB
MGAATLHFENPIGFKLKNAFDGISVWREQALAERIELEEMQREKNSALEVSLVRRSQGAYEGYTLYTLYNEQKAHLLNMDGTKIHEWNKPFEDVFPEPKHVTKPKGRIYWADAKLFPNGDLLVQYHGAIDTPYGYGMAKLDKNSKVIWSYASNTHHEFDIDKNGNIYGLTQKWYKEPIPDYSDIISPPALLDSIFVLNAEGKELQKFDLIDAFRGTPYQELLRIDSIAWKIQGDYFHTNSIRVLKEHVDYTIPGVKAGQVLVSIRNPGIICIIDLETKRVVWATKGPWKQQHSVHFIDDGKIMMFDNQGWGGGRSRVMAIDPVTLKETWSFPVEEKDYFYSKIRGMSHLLPNGNVLITDSNNGRIFEVGSKGDVYWEVKIDRLYTDGKKYGQVICSGSRYSQNSLPFVADIIINKRQNIP